MMYFPKKFSSVTEIDFYVNMKQKLISELSLIIDPENVKAQVILKKAREYFANQVKPRIFVQHPDNYIVYLESTFEDLVCVLEDNGTTNAKRLTVFEFMKRTEFIENKFDTKQQ